MARLERQTPVWMSGRAAASLTIGGAALLVLVLIVAQFLPDWRFGRGGETAASGNSAIGLAGFADMLSDLGLDVIKHRLRSYEALPPDALIVMPMGHQFQLIQLRERLQEMRPSQDALIVLPRWRADDVARQGWLRTYRDIGPEGASYAFDGFVTTPSDEDHRADTTLITAVEAEDCAVAFTDAGRVTFEALEGAPLHAGFEADGLFERTILGCGDYVLIGEVEADVGTGGTRKVNLLTDPGLIANLRLSDGTAMRTMLSVVIDLADGGERAVVFDETLAGPPRNPDLWTAAFTPPMLGVTLVALMLFVLWLWAAVPRFGAPFTEPPALRQSKRALVRNTAGLMLVKPDYGKLLGAYRDGLMADLDRSAGLPDTQARAQTSQTRLFARASSRGLGESWDEVHHNIDQVAGHGMRTAGGVSVLMGTADRLHRLTTALRPASTQQQHADPPPDNTV